MANRSVSKRPICLVLSGDGVGDLAVNAWLDDDHFRGAIWILFLDGAFCSDGTRNGAEQCDDGNIAGGDGCDHVCRVPEPAMESS